MQNNIEVLLGEKSYRIVTGANQISYLEKFLSDKNYSKIIIITDENVANLHLAKLTEVLSNGKISTNIIVTKPGESAKSFANLEKIAEEILSKEIDRKSLIIAFGGGVVGDLSGFLASILLRGIDFIQIPTSLLAMVDSSVGGKTAINSKHGKNLIGSFYQPKLVICDPNFLLSLDSRQMKAGYAEIVKSALIKDKDFFKFLDQNLEDKFLAKTDLEYLSILIAKSCEIKAKIVSEDETEQESRMLLNFGHSFAHIFETETNYSDEILHGEAVSIGMVMAAEMSKNYQLITAEDVSKISSHLKRAGLPISANQIRASWNIENLSRHLYKDKKTENKNLTFVLLKDIGDAIVRKSVPYADFLKLTKF
jgi:3-dehydroquinate synthase